MGAPFELNQGRGQCHGIPSVERPGLRARLSALQSMSPGQTFQGRLATALASGSTRLLFLGDSSNQQAMDDLYQCSGAKDALMDALNMGRRIDDGHLFDKPFNFSSGGFVNLFHGRMSKSPTCDAGKARAHRTIIVANFGMHYARGSVNEKKNPGVNVSASWTQAQFVERFRRDVKGFGDFITTEILPRYPHAVVLWHGSFSQHFNTPIGDFEDPPETPKPRSVKCVAAPTFFGYHSELSWRDREPFDEVKRLNHPDVYFLPMGRLTRLIPPEVHPRYIDCTHLCKAPFAWEGLYWALTEVIKSYSKYVNHESMTCPVKVR